jgi:two-component system, NtrC family, nitrogen regulation sensor histidine kinase NtrY
MNRLRNRLILALLAATLVPLAGTVWITTTLLQRSLEYSSPDELDRVARLLQRTGREFYQHQREELKQHAAAGAIAPQRYLAAERGTWPAAVAEFADSGEADRFAAAGEQGNRLEYMVRRGDGVLVYAQALGGVAMQELTSEIRRAHETVEAARHRDLMRGFTLTYIVLAALVWVCSLGLLVYLAARVSQPIHKLTAGLTLLAAGDLAARVEPGRDDEVGKAIDAFNDMAARLQESTKRLVYLGQLESWQSLARKMAHEVKNSLTPIRLTVEEMMARYDDSDRSFMEQATQIVVEEIEILERRIRAFSQFAAEPPLMPSEVDANSLVEERVAFLRTAHPEVAYECRLAAAALRATADADLVKGILTNLLENAAEAAGEAGRILVVTSLVHGMVVIEVHDSGPGLSEQAQSSLFQPTISFKKRGMGLGLSIARKSALLSGGDIEFVKGELGGAAFRVLLPESKHGLQAHIDRG